MPGRRGGRGGGRMAAARGRTMARMTVRRMTRRRTRRRAGRRRRRRRRILLVGGMVAVGYAGYKMSKRDVERVEEHTGKNADELTDEQLEQAMAQLGIEQETMSDAEWEEAEKTDAEWAETDPDWVDEDEADYLAELERLAELHEKGILTDAEFETKKKQILNI